MERKGRSRRRRFSQTVKQNFDGVLATLLTIAMILNMSLSGSGLSLKPFDSFASGTDEEGGTVWATASNAKLAERASKDVDIYVTAEDNDIAPGNTTSFTLYLKNNTSDPITDGVLSFKSKYIDPEDGVFTHVAMDEEVTTIVGGAAQTPQKETSGEELTETETDAADEEPTSAIDEGQAETEEPTEAEAVTTEPTETEVTKPEAPAPKETILDKIIDTIFPDEGEAADDNTDSEEATLEDITLQPGALYKVQFDFYTADDFDSKKANVKFIFKGLGDNDVKLRTEEKFSYSIGLPTVNAELGNTDNKVETGVDNDLNLWLSEPDWVDEKLEERIEKQEQDKADAELAADEANDTGSTTTATGSNAPKATASDAPAPVIDNTQVSLKDETTIEKYTGEAMTIKESKVNYTVEIRGANVTKFQSNKLDGEENIGWINTVYRLANDVKPGMYYGKVTANGKWNNRAFTSEQGFLFEVVGEGDPSQDFEEKLDGVTVTAHAEEGVLPEGTTMKVTHLKEEDDKTADQFQEAKKALDDDPDTEYDGMMALDITFYNDRGKEIEPNGAVDVSINLDKTVLPEDVDPESVEVLHLDESTGDTVIEKVADTADATDGKVEVKEDTAAVAEFSVESFSTFTITWNNTSAHSKYFDITIHYVDEAGNELPESVMQKTNIAFSLSGLGSQTYKMSDYLTAIAGYQQLGAHYQSVNGTTISRIVLEKINVQGGKQERQLIAYDSNNEELEKVPYVAELITRDIYLVYQPTSLTVAIADTITSDGRFTAVLSKPEQSAGITYEWYTCSENSAQESAWKKIDQGVYDGEAILSPDETSVNVALAGAAVYGKQSVRPYYKVKIFQGSDDSKKFLSEATLQIPFYNELQNGSFETPVYPGSGKINQVSNDAYKNADGVWQTTGPNNGKDIEIINVRGGISNLYSWFGPQMADEGNQFAELNCEAVGALYQDVFTLPGQPLNYWLSHRARGKENSKKQEFDTMYVVIMPTSIASAAGNAGGAIDTQEELTAFLAEKQITITDAENKDLENAGNELYNQDGIYVCEFRSDDQGWHFYSEEEAYTPISVATRFFFVAGKTASGSKTIGNFLDRVGFGQDIPDRDGGVIHIQKTVLGISEADASNYQVGIKVGDKSITLSDFEKQDDGSYVASTDVTLYEDKEYKVEEVLMDNDAWKANYSGPVTQVKLNNGEYSSGTSTSVSVSSGSEDSVSFKNEYASKVKLTVKKLVAGNMGDKDKDFDFEIRIYNGSENVTGSILKTDETFTVQTGNGGDTYASFKLKHDGSIENIPKMPSGYTVVVKEVHVEEGYITEVAKNDTGSEGTPIKGAPGSFKIDSLTQDTVITFTNTKNVDTPTGISRTSIPYYLILALAVLAMTGFTYTKRRKETE